MSRASTQQSVHAREKRETRATPLVLVADDQKLARSLIAGELEAAGCRVVQVTNSVEAWRAFQLQAIDLVITDLRMPGGDGLSLLRRIVSAHSPNPQVPVLLISALGDLAVAAEAGRAGAVDLFACNESGIRDLLERALKMLERADPGLPLPLLGESPEALRLRQRAEAFAPLDAPLLLCGEPGSGRESIARYLHHRSRHAALAFVVVTRDKASSMLSRIPEGTVYLKDFERFTGEDQVRWLERVADLDALGASARARLLASAEAPFESLSVDGRPSDETARRIHRFRIDVPSLARRAEDLPALIAELVRRVVRRLERREPCFENGALEALAAHGWRRLDELEACVESLIALAPRERISFAVVASALAELEAPLDRIDAARRRVERGRLIELYRKHGTYSGVARELGITRNAAKYRLAKHDLLHRCRSLERTGPPASRR